MEADEIFNFCSTLSLTDEDGEIMVIGRDLKKKGVDITFRCLVGRILDTKQVSIAAFRKGIQHIWQPVGKHKSGKSWDVLFLLLGGSKKNIVYKTLEF